MEEELLQEEIYSEEYMEDIDDGIDIEEDLKTDESTAITTDPIEAILHEIGSVPIMKGDDFTYQFQKYKETGDIFYRNKIVEGNLRLVASIAKRFRKYHSIYNDLIQEGTFGLVNAIEKFDPSMGNAFSTYATYWIRQAIMRYLDTNENFIRVPIHMSDKLRKLRNVTEELTLKLGTTPSLDMILEKTGFTEEEYNELLLMPICDISLDQTARPDDDGDATLSDFIAVSEDPGAEEIYLTNERNKLLYESINTLTERERVILNRRFGLSDGQRETLSIIAKDLDISRERVRQQEEKALYKLRHKPKLRKYYLGNKA